MTFSLSSDINPLSPELFVSFDKKIASYFIFLVFKTTYSIFLFFLIYV